MWTSSRTPGAQVLLKGVHRSELFGVWLAGANCVVALSAFSVAESYDAVRLLAGLSILLFGVLLFCHLDNFLFLGRTLLLGLPGYYPIAVKVLAGEDALFSLYEPSTQSLDIATVMYVATGLALLGSEIGLVLGSRYRHPSGLRLGGTDPELWRTIFYISIPIVVLVSALVIRSAPTVFTAVYSTEIREGYLLGNTQNIAIICLLSMFVAMHKVDLTHGRVTFTLLAALFLMGALFLRGLRQDAVTTLFGLVICYGVVRGRPYRVSVRSTLVLIALIAVMEFMGVARGMLAVDGTTTGDIWSQFTSTLFYVSGTYHFGTVSPDATTFANTVYLIDSQTMDPLWGRSYFEFISRTPPAFIYPDRPLDYAFMFADYNLGSGGAIFELAEAYMNFGLVGTLLVPGLLSFMMARAFVNAMHRQTATSYFLLFSFLGIFLRGALYQTFAFYKSFLTAVILLFCFTAAHAVMTHRRLDSNRVAPARWR